MSHYPKLPSPVIIKQLQNFPWADQSRRFILSVVFRVRVSVGWPVNNFLLCCLHKKWSKRAEDVSICLTLISEECNEVTIVSTAHTFRQNWKYLRRRKLQNSPVSELLSFGCKVENSLSQTYLCHQCIFVVEKSATIWPFQAVLGQKMNNSQSMNRPPFYVALLVARRDTIVLIHW